MEFFRNVTWDIIGRSRLWFTISAVVIVGGLLAVGVRGLNYGIDFTGGSLLRYGFAEPLATTDREVPGVIGQVRSMLAPMNLATSQIQVLGDERGRLTHLYVRTPEVAHDAEAAERDRAVRAGLGKLFPEKGAITDLGRETVGPVVGADLRNRAILAFALGCIGILIYITARYEFRFAIAGISALVHDALVVFGCMAVFQVELNSGFVAAILTVLGYSINDSVVIFDRIRENMRLHRRANFAETVNASLLQTMARSVNTMLTVLFTVVALVVLGGESIRPFALALMFGVTVGCYSSILHAGPVLVLWESRAAKSRARALAAARSRGQTRPAAGRPAPSAAADATEAVDMDEDVESAPGVSSSEVINRLQQEVSDERRHRVEAEVDEKREERRERRKREKDRAAKKAGKPKRRF